MQLQRPFPTLSVALLAVIAFPATSLAQTKIGVAALVKSRPQVVDRGAEDDRRNHYHK